MQTLASAILEVLNEKPMSSTELADRLEAKRNSIKITLCKLVKREKVLRIKMPRTNSEIKAGPVNVYMYTTRRGEEVSRVPHKDEITGSIPVAATNQEETHA